MTYFLVGMPPSLSKCVDAWKELQASPEIVNLVQSGHKIKFEHKPTLTKPCKKYSTVLPAEQMSIVRHEVQTLVSKGAVQILSKDFVKSNLGVYSKLFCVPKAGTTKWRPVINLKPLNKYISKESFKMETLKDVRATVNPGDYGATVDLTDAYFHVKIHKNSRKFLRFIFE